MLTYIETSRPWTGPFYRFMTTSEWQNTNRIFTLTKKYKIMRRSSLLNLFRMIMAFFLILSFMVFSEMDDVLSLFGMMLTVMMAIAYIIAEIISSMEDKAKH